MSEFANEPLLELRRAPERERLASALSELDGAGVLEIPTIVGGERRLAPTLASLDPGNPARVVALATVATANEVSASVAAATDAALAWGATQASERAEVLSRAAAELRSSRYALAALEVRECAKPWAEADADVCEAIDFLEFYGRAALGLGRGEPLMQLRGEQNSLHYRPRGVLGVVAPWNFPVAIAAGMVAAGLATGNAVCFKPAEQAPACAHALVEALLRAGLPPGAISLLPGEGDVGAALVAEPGVQTIAFTGSGAVGLEIIRRAADVIPGQKHLKRVIAEMGGKNCVIVDADADLDEAVPAVLASAFGFAGQKCSAASRVLVHQRVASRFAERLEGALDTLLVGQAESFGVDVPPLIDAAARDRVESMVADAAERAHSVLRVAEIPEGDGYFVAPTVLRGVDPTAPILREEVFGPVVTVEAVAGVEHACEIVDGLAHALTGGLFSRNPRTVAAVTARTPVGNLYVNRAITGAMVGRQPFGGNRLSGTGTKVGHPHYLLNFVEPLVVSENTARHGVTP